MILHSLISIRKKRVRGDTTSGRFMDINEYDKPFKGVAEEETDGRKKQRIAKRSPPYEGGVASASDDGVVLCLRFVLLDC
jgi:hypothetical protein